MLDLVRQDDFYGSAAEDVVAGCREANDTFEVTWICFRSTGEDAVETRELIGVENMVDPCYAAVSDPETYDRPEERYAEERRKHFGDEFFFGGGMYRPFQGCRTPTEEESGDEMGDAGASDDGLTAEACAAYQDLEGVLASRTSDEMRVMWTAVQAMSKTNDPSSLAPLGVSEPTIEFFRTAKEGRGQGGRLYPSRVSQQASPRFDGRDVRRRDDRRQRARG